MKARVLQLKYEIEQESEIAFGQRFLELTGLKIGDTVQASFHCSYGDRKQSYISSKDCSGIIKQYENGSLYVESVDKLQQSYNRCNNRSGRDRRSWWMYELEFTKAKLTDIFLPE